MAGLLVLVFDQPMKCWECNEFISWIQCWDFFFSLSKAEWYCWKLVFSSYRKHFITELRPRILGFVFFTHLQGRMVSYMWMSWRVCLIVRESGIGWNHWKSVLCQIVRGFLIGCHWQSIIPLTVRESLIGYEFLFLFMLPMNKVISGTRQITMCLWCHQNL